MNCPLSVAERRRPPTYNGGRQMSDLVITLIGSDRPGLVEAVAATVAEHGGNWLEGRMAHLGGKFAGILRVAVPAERAGALSQALSRLESSGLHVLAEEGGAPVQAAARAMEVELLGLDRPGLVREVSRLLASRRVNVEELATDVYSAPMSGDAMFRARARVNVPAGVDAQELRRSLERLAGDLMVEIRLADTE
jgi:glycine cleavage system regulatory protein